MIGVNRPGAALITNLHLAPRVKKRQSYITTTLLGLRGHFYGQLHLCTLFQKSFEIHPGKCVNITVFWDSTLLKKRYSYTSTPRLGLGGLF